eukprot:2448665-Prymnesium_polylepis.2
MDKRAPHTHPTGAGVTRRVSRSRLRGLYLSGARAKPKVGVSGALHPPAPPPPLIASSHSPFLPSHPTHAAGSFRAARIAPHTLIKHCMPAALTACTVAVAQVSLPFAVRRDGLTRHRAD